MIIQRLEKSSVRNVAIYLRLSKDDGDTEESESISNQRAIILDYIKKNFNYEKYYEYVDDGVSGATFDRPGFKKMIQELKINEIDLVITKNLARFARNYIEAGEYIEKLFPNNNIRYIAILDGVDNFEDKIANEFAPIKGVFNELFCKETSKGVKRSKRKKMLDGYYSCNVAPYGYMKDPDNQGKLIIDEVASINVKRIFKLTLEGKTAKQIADLFNKEEIITPAEYLKVKGLENRTKKVWTRSIITRILANEVYTGKCLRGKTQNISYKSKKRIYVKRSEQITTEKTHEPIITEEIYNKIHDNNKFGKTASGKEGIDAKFSKYMYCGKCKKRMAKRKSRNFINVHCPSRNESSYLCSNNILYKYEDLESLIIKDIEKEFAKFLKKSNLNTSLMKKYNDIEVKKINIQLKELNKELGLLRFKITKLYNDRLQESILEENYKKLYKELTQKRKDIREIIKNLENEKEKLNSNENIAKIKKVKEILKNLNKDILSNEDISELIDKIEVYENYIHIYYKFEKKPSKIVSCKK
ncbi:MAG: recombinase family protein [Clostridia bacterium]|nr:recombinase family protein [Clostridia bacterium]